MSRTSLREFQTRLAQRLSAAQTGQSPSRWLAVMAGQRHLLLPLEQAGEISPVQRPTALPHAQPWFLGLVNLRGQLCGAVHLGQFLGEAAQPVGAQARLIQFATDLDINAALLVDQLVGLRSPDQLQPDSSERSQGNAEPPQVSLTPTGGGSASRPWERAEESPPWIGAAYRDQDRQVWQVLDLVALAESDAFLRVV